MAWNTRSEGIQSMIASCLAGKPQYGGNCAPSVHPIKLHLAPICCLRVIGGLLASANRPFLTTILLVRKETWMLTIEGHSSVMLMARLVDPMALLLCWILLVCFYVMTRLKLICWMSIFSVFTRDNDQLPIFKSRIALDNPGIGDISISPIIIDKLLKKLKFSTGARSDRLPASFFKNSVPFLIFPLSILFQCYYWPARTTHWMEGSCYYPHFQKRWPIRC